MKATNFRFDAQTNELLNKLKEESDASSKAEVIRSAIKLLNVANKAKKEKKHLIIKDENGNETEILI